MLHATVAAPAPTSRVFPEAVEGVTTDKLVYSMTNEAGGLLASLLLLELVVTATGIFSVTLSRSESEEG